MKDKDAVLALLAHLDKTQSLLDKIMRLYEDFCVHDLSILGKKQTTAMTTAEILVDYYTCLETLFFRISQFFENGLSKERWHSDLLERMTLEIPKVRNAFIDDYLKRELDELLRFRHFRRYYFELDYDWDKLDYLTCKLKSIHNTLLSRFAAYRDFLKAIEEAIDSM